MVITHISLIYIVSIIVEILIVRIIPETVMVVSSLYHYNTATHIEEENEERRKKEERKTEGRKRGEKNPERNKCPVCFNFIC